jgi:hypothetical protein
MRWSRSGSIVAVLLAASACSSTKGAGPSGEPALLSPPELVRSLADVANGRNADMSKTGLVLKSIELRLLVGRESRAGGKVSFLVLDAEAARRSEVSFAQAFTLELPPPSRTRSVAPAAAVPGVVEFVEAAMATAREIAAAASTEGLPQKLREVELTAKIVRSQRLDGGIAFTAPGAPALSAGAGRVDDEANSVRLVFGAR